jgi:hypothetical protein
MRVFEFLPGEIVSDSSKPVNYRATLNLDAIVMFRHHPDSDLRMVHLSNGHTYYLSESGFKRLVAACKSN